MKKSIDVRKLVTIAVFSALAYVVSFFSIPVAGFLSFELKDCIIAIAGFTYGPLAAFCCALLSAFAELISFSKTGIIGCIMNLVSSASFACTAAFIYKYKRDIKGAIVGLSVSCAVLTIVMLAWNYILTPLYTGAPREQVVKMLLPVLLPFNLAKGIVNASVTVLLYKPIVNVLRRMKLVAPSKSSRAYKLNWGLIAVVVFFVITGGVVLSLIPSNNGSNTPESQESAEVAEQIPEEGVYEQIDQTEAKELIDGEEPVVILDVRTYEEYNQGHIEGALCIPVETISEDSRAQIEMLIPNKEQIILVYCRSGNRSKTASERLADMGYVNVKEFGGINSWEYGTVKK